MLGVVRQLVAQDLTKQTAEGEREGEVTRIVALEVPWRQRQLRSSDQSDMLESEWRSKKV